MGRSDLLKALKIKPAKPLDLSDPKEVEEIRYGVMEPAAKPVIPPVTEAERAAWAKTRALQQVDEKGIPVEGWAARLAAMEADGRLYRIGNVLHQRG